MAGRLTAVVLLIQAALLVMFVLDPTEPPRNGAFWQALWALGHKPAFVPLVVLMVIGPPASWLAWSTAGAHRLWLAGGWAIFAAAALTWFAHRIWVMTALLWEHGV